MVAGEVGIPSAPGVGPKFDLFNELGSLNMLTNSWIAGPLPCLAVARNPDMK